MKIGLYDLLGAPCTNKRVDQAMDTRNLQELMVGSDHKPNPTIHLEHQGRLSIYPNHHD